MVQLWSGDNPKRFCASTMIMFHVIMLREGTDPYKMKQIHSNSFQIACGFGFRAKKIVYY